MLSGRMTNELILWTILREQDPRNCYHWVPHRASSPPANGTGYI